MKDGLKRWLVVTLAVLAAAHLVPGIEYASWQALVIAALVLALLNVFVKPLLLLISLPFILLTLGFFLILVNAILLALTAWIVPGFEVGGFWPAVGGALIISLVNLFFGGTKAEAKAVRNQNNRRPPSGPQPPPGSGPIIDI
jgi:putative membrane protein